MKLERLHFIAKVTYEEQHSRVGRQNGIDRKPDVDKLLEGTGPIQESWTLVEIVNVEPYISTYYQATKDLVEAQKSKFEFDHASSKPPDIEID